MHPTSASTAPLSSTSPAPVPPAARRRLRLALLLLGTVAVAPLLSALDPDRSLHQYNIRTWRRGNGLPASAVNAVAQPADRYIWLGTSKGLVQFDGVEFRTVGLPGMERPAAPLVTSLAPRAGGGLWFGLERGGLGTWTGTVAAALHRPELGDSSFSTRTLLARREGGLIVGTETGAAAIGADGQARVLVPAADVIALHEDGQGRVWLGTSGGRLLYLEDGRVRNFPAEPGLWHDREISAVAVDRAGVIWVGATNGLFAFNPDFTPRPATGVTAQPRALLVDAHGVLWVGTDAEGLLRFRGGAFTRLRHQDGLASDHILALAESEDGSLWVGTDDGLSQLADVKFPLFASADGFASDVCLAVAASPRGGVWAATANGLTHFHEGTARNFGVDKADGFYSRWIKRVFEARSGDVYLLGGRKSLQRFSGGRVVRSWVFDQWPRAIAEDSRGLLLAVAGNLMRLEQDTVVPVTLADGSAVTVGWINDLLTGPDDALWIAHNDGVIEIRDGVRHDRAATLGRDDPVFLSLTDDGRGGIWATRRTGLVRFAGGDAQVVDRRHGLPDDLVYKLVPDGEGTLWMDSPGGIFSARLDDLEAVATGRTGRLRCAVYAGQHAVKTTDKANPEYTGCRSLDGRIWFPSTRGLVMIDPRQVPVDTHPPPTRLDRILVNGRSYPPGRPPEVAPGPGHLEFDFSALDYHAPERIRYRHRLEGYQDQWVDAGARRTATFTNLPPGRYRFHVQASNADGVWNTTGDSIEIELPPRFHETLWFRGLLAAAVLAALGLVWHARERRRRRELAEIQRREELQRTMIESSPVAMALFDRAQRLLHANSAFARLFGFTGAEVPDQAAFWRLLVPEPNHRADLADLWNRRLDAAARDRQPIAPLETTVTSRDGLHRTVLFTTSAVGERTLVAYADLTERKRAEQERQRLEEQLRQGQKMEAIGQLSGGIAHDFNNLLTVILGSAMMIDSGEPLPPSARGPLEEIRKSARRAANLTRQLLAFSRKQPMRQADLDLNAVVHDMSQMLRRILGEDIAMDLALAPSLPAVRADAGMIEQVVLNLAVNARDAMPRGGRLTVATHDVTLDTGPADRTGRFVRLSVADTGCGIPPEILPRIFEPFFTTKDVGKGTGLGLATVYGIVVQHRGWIDVESDTGKGATFHVHLPAATAPAAAPAAPAAAAALPSSPPLTVLLVEDEDSVRELAQVTLARRGHRVLTAASGPAALRLWPEIRDSVDVLLTDLVMPEGMTGLELARRLRSDRPGLRVICTSGYSAELARSEPAADGIEFLPKPYDPHSLLAVLHRAEPPGRP